VSEVIAYLFEVPPCVDQERRAGVAQVMPPQPLGEASGAYSGFEMTQREVVVPDRSTFCGAEYVTCARRPVLAEVRLDLIGQEGR
jgi:hypothetical protein